MGRLKTIILMAGYGLLSALPLHGQSRTAKCDSSLRLASMAPTMQYKGRLQDAGAPQTIHILELKKKAIPLLIGCLTDETRTKEPIANFWPVTTVGDIAFFYLCDLFTDSTWEHPTIDGVVNWKTLETGPPQRKLGVKPGRQARPSDGSVAAAKHLPVAESAAEDAATEASFELREYLRGWRRIAAKEQGVPAFIVMHDTSLDELCRMQPRSLQEVRRVHGFGERKVEMYGKQILEALKRFREGARALAVPEKRRKNLARKDAFLSAAELRSPSRSLTCGWLDVCGTVPVETCCRHLLREDNSYRHKNIAATRRERHSNFHARSFRILIAAPEAEAAARQIFTHGHFFAEASLPDARQNAGFHAGSIPRRVNLGSNRR
jgi:hypothetical protein